MLFFWAFGRAVRCTAKACPMTGIVSRQNTSLFLGNGIILLLAPNRFLCASVRIFSVQGVNMDWTRVRLET